MKREMTYNVFIDDKLRPLDIFYKTSNPLYKEQFVVIKSYSQFTEHIEEQFKKEGTYPGFISFDYLLADVIMQVTEDFTVFNNEESYTPTGFECAQWIVDFCKTNNLPLPKYNIHDMNPTGRRLISKAFNKSSVTMTASDPFIEKTTVVVKDSITENPIHEVPKTVKPEKTEKKANSETKKANSVINKTKDKELITGILIESLKGKSLSKKEIDVILIPEFSDSYTLKQKKTKIENIMWELKLKGIIVNTGTIRVPSWKLVKKEKK